MPYTPRLPGGTRLRLELGTPRIKPGPPDKAEVLDEASNEGAIEAPSPGLPNVQPALLSNSKAVTSVTTGDDGLWANPAPAHGLTGPASATPPVSGRERAVPLPAYAFPWPDALSDLGHRRVQAFDLCADCRTGSWVVYGDRALCLACARSRAFGAVKVVAGRRGA
jgi:hypothetical protein